MDNSAKTDDEAVRRTAYFLWEQAGRPAGQENHYWLEAEAMHRRQRAYDLWLQEGAPDGKADEHWNKAGAK